MSAPAHRTVSLLVLAMLCACGSDAPPPADAGDALCEGSLDRALVTASTLAIDLTTDRARTRHSLRAPRAGTCCASLACEPEPEPGAAQWDGAPVEVTWDGATLEACGPCSCDAEPALEIDGALREHRVPGTDAGFYRLTDGAGRAYTRLAAWLGTCGGLVPCDASIGHLQRFTFDVRHAPEQIVLCPGTREVLADGHTRCELAGTLAPPYAALALAASDAWQERLFAEIDGARVVFFEPPGGRVAEAIDAGAVAAFVRWMTRELGPLPYGDELRVATMPSGWLGYEHPANVVLDETLAARTDTGYASPALHTLLHEIAHQWAGDRTTPASVADAAWKEAIAEYLVYVFEDEQRPPGEAAATRATWHRYARFPPAYPRPTDAPAREVILAVAYGLAPMATFLQLEPLVGRPALLRAIFAFLREPGARDTDALIAEIERASGRSLEAYASAWIVGAGEPPLPYLEASFTSLGDGRGELSVTQSGPGERAFPAVVEVLLRAGGGDVRARVDFGLEPSARVARTIVALEGAPLEIEIDPDDRLADSPIPWDAARPLVPRPIPL